MSVHKNLEWLLSPLDKPTFLQQYLENKPIVIKRGQPDYFRELLTVEDLDQVIAKSETTGSYDIRLAHFQKKIDLAAYAHISKTENISVKTGIDPVKVLSHFHEELATIIIDDAIHAFPLLKDFSQTINQDLQCATGANIYITPASSQGFTAHYDTHDVFILQVYGKKRWKIYGDPVTLPLSPQLALPFSLSSLELLYEADVEQGDTVYIPRGFVHEAMTGDCISAHITLGAYITTWTRLLIDYIKAAGLQEDILKKDFLMAGLKTGDDKAAVVQDILGKIKQDLTLDKLQLIANRYHKTAPELPSLADRQ